MKEVLSRDVLCARSVMPFFMKGTSQYTGWKVHFFRKKSVKVKLNVSRLSEDWM